MTIVRRKSSKDMTNFLNAKKNGRLLGSVERHLQAKPREARRWDILHPSAISKPDWCVRAAWYVVTSIEPPKAERLNRRSAAIFGEGNLIHEKYQTWFKEMGVLFGKWRCRVCGHKTPSMTLPPSEPCPGCFALPYLFEYAEVPLENPDWLLAGHADGWIKNIGTDVLIEIKSVGIGTVRYEAPNMFMDYDGNLDEIWKNLKRPFSSHLNQAQIYVRVLHAMRDDAPNDIVFIYECKSNQDAREFVVPYSEAATDPIIEKCLIVKKHVDLGSPPKCLTRGGCKECRPYKETA